MLFCGTNRTKILRIGKISLSKVFFAIRHDSFEMLELFLFKVSKEGKVFPLKRKFNLTKEKMARNHFPCGTLGFARDFYNLSKKERTYMI